MEGEFVMKTDIFNIDNQNHENISAEHKLFLYWFQKYIEGTEFDVEDYLKTELNTSTIDKFNECVNSFIKLHNENEQVSTKPIRWDNRKTIDGFYKKLQMGSRFEHFVSEEFKKYNVNLGMQYNEYQWQGENLFGLEIKNDDAFKRTGNLFIEYCERHDVNKSFVKSGIHKNDNTVVFLIGVPDNYFIVLKDVLCDVYEKLKAKDPETIKYCRFATTNNNGSKGILIKEEYMKKICLTQSIKEFCEIYVRDNKIIDKVHIYKDAKGKFFHNSNNKKCNYRPKNKYYTVMSLSEAFIKGYRPCNSCFKK